MLRIAQGLCILVCSGFVLSVQDSIAEDRLTLSAGLDYSVSDYGTSRDTEMLYLPLSAKYETDDVILKLTVPFILTSGSSGVIHDVGPIRKVTGSKINESGMGDIIASVSKNFYSNLKDKSFVDITGKLKLGTAQASKSLGTGEDDISIQLDAYKLINKNTLFGTAGYTFTGDPPANNLNNVFYFLIGGSQKTDPVTTLGGMLFLKEKTSVYSSSQTEVTLFATRNLDQKRKMQFYFSLGLAQGSPDYGGGVVVSYLY